jgi:hypothetical protein
VGGTVVEQAAPRGDRTHQRQLFQRTNSPNHNSRNPLLAAPTKPTLPSPPPPAPRLCDFPPWHCPGLLSSNCAPIFHPFPQHAPLPRSSLSVWSPLFVGVQPGQGGVEY